MSRQNNRKSKCNTGKGRNQRNNFRDNTEVKDFRKGKERGRSNGVYPIDTQSSDNDSEWYGANPELVRDAASIPFSRLAGRPILNKPENTLNSYADSYNWIKVGGVQVLNWVPSIGGTGAQSNTATSGINIAANALYSYVRHANSGSKNYDANNLGMYQLAMTDAYSYYAALTRIYGLAMKYSNTSVIAPRLLFAAMSVDLDDIAQNLANFRLGINYYAKRLRARAIPSTMHYATRHIWMNSNVYADAEGDKAQMYMYVQQQYYVYDPISGNLTLTMPKHTENGVTYNVPMGSSMGRLDTKDMKTRTGLLTAKDLLDFGEVILAPIMAAEDFGIMSGDISRAFGNNVFGVNPIAETFEVDVSYSAEVLSQFENATCFGINNPYGHFPIAYGGISQSRTVGASLIRNEIRLMFDRGTETSPTIDDATLQQFTVLERGGLLLNMHNSPVTPEDVMVSTRMACKGMVPYSPISDGAFNDVPARIEVGNKTYGNYWQYTYETMGTELLISMPMWYWDIDVVQNTGTSSVIHVYDRFTDNLIYTIGGDGVTTSSGALLQFIDRLAMVNNFDWAPAMNLVNYIKRGDHVSTHFMQFDSRDLDNYTVIDEPTLAEMHRVAILSEVQCRNMDNFNIR